MKWTDERSESFMSDSHGRDHEMTAELALAANGKFLAVRVTGYGNVGAWLNSATTIPPTMNTVKNIIGVYATPLIQVSTKCLFTNTTPVGAYRGAGRPEGNYYMERLVDTAAARWASTGLSYAAAIISSRNKCPTRPPPACCTTLASFQRSWNKPCAPATGMAIPRVRPPARARQNPRPRHRPLPGGHRRRRQ